MSNQSETVVLGSMMLDAIAISDATEILRPEDFSFDSNQRIYRSMLTLIERGQAFDGVTVMQELERRKELEAVGGAGYLADLIVGIPKNFSIEGHVRAIKNDSLRRQLLRVCTDGVAQSSETGEDATAILNNIEASLAEISDSAIQTGVCDIPTIVANSFGSIDALYEQGREVTGLATRYIEFDKMTSGLQKSELIIIAARPSMGKTALAINIAQNCAVRDGKVVLVFSLEMSKESLLRRMLASEATVGSRKLQTGFIPREDRGRLVAGLDRLMSSKMFIDDRAGITLAEIRAKARRLKQQEGALDLIVIDYLQLMTGTKRDGKSYENRTQEVSSLSRGLKALAKELCVPVVALSQLSRGSEQRSGDKKPLLSDLRESGSIEQDADVVAFIHRAEYYDRENEDLKGKAELIIAKQRNGPIGTVHLAYIADWTRFENLSGAEPGQPSLHEYYRD